MGPVAEAMMTSFVMTGQHGLLHEAMPMGSWHHYEWPAMAGNLHTEASTGHHNRQSSNCKLRLGCEW